LLDFEAYEISRKEEEHLFVYTTTRCVVEGAWASAILGKCFRPVT